MEENKNILNKKCINPKNIIYYEYFEKLKKKAIIQGQTNLVIAFKKIISSIFKYPLPINNSYDAFKLKGVGKQFSFYFEKALKENKNENIYDSNKNKYINYDNYIIRVIKNADIFLNQLKDVDNLKIKNDFEHDNTFINLNEIKNDKLDVEIMSVKKKKKNNKNINNNVNNSINNDKNKNNVNINNYINTNEYENNEKTNDVNIDNENNGNIKDLNIDECDKNTLYNPLYFKHTKEPFIISKIYELNEDNIFNLCTTNNEDNINSSITQINNTKKTDIISQNIEIHEDLRSFNFFFKKMNENDILNEIEITILCIIDKCDYLYKENTMSKDEIYEEILKNYKKNITINFRYINKLTKYKLLEKIDYDFLNNETKNSSLKKKKKKITKMKLTEKGKTLIKNVKNYIENEYKTIKDNTLLIKNTEKNKIEKNETLIENISNIMEYKDIDTYNKNTYVCNNEVNELNTSNRNECNIQQSEINISNNEEKIDHVKDNFKEIENMDIKKNESDFILKKRRNFNELLFTSDSNSYSCSENTDKKNKPYMEKETEYYLTNKEKENYCVKNDKQEEKLNLNNLNEDDSFHNVCEIYSSETDKKLNELKNKYNEKFKLSLIERIRLKNEIEEKEKNNKSISCSEIEEKFMKIKNNVKNSSVCKIKNINTKTVEENANINSNDNFNEIDSLNINNTICHINDKVNNLIDENNKLFHDYKNECENINEKKNNEQDYTLNISNEENMEAFDNSKNLEKNELNNELFNENYIVSKNILTNNNNNNNNNNNKKRKKKNVLNNDNEIIDTKITKKKKNNKKKNKINEMKEIQNDYIKHGPYEIIMIIDNRDISGIHSEYFEKIKIMLEKNNIKYLTRNLPLGDIVWICRKPIYKKKGKKGKNEKKNIENITNENIINKNITNENIINKNITNENITNENIINKNIINKNITNENIINKNITNNINQDDLIENSNIYEIEYEEYVLKWVIERKTLNDLSSSIIDGRYDEQKYRLMRTKNSNHIIYLIENTTNTFKNYTNIMKLPFNTLENAIISTQLISGFSVIQSQSMNHTAYLLSEIHLQIINNIKNICQINENELYSEKLSNYLQNNACIWMKWNEDSKKSKNKFVKEIFGKQLRLLNMCSSDATEFILYICPTPFKLNQLLNKYTHDGILAEKLKQIYIKNYDSQDKKKIKTPINIRLIALLRKLYAPDTISF